MKAMLIVRKTRFKELGFWQLEPGDWRFVDLTGDKPAQIGGGYATKAELLANVETKAVEFGCEDAMYPSTMAKVLVKITEYNKALREIVSLWPDPDCAAELAPEFIGPNDGRMRADKLWYALNAARTVLGLPTYPEPEHWNKPKRSRHTANVDLAMDILDEAQRRQTTYPVTRK